MGNKMAFLDVNGVVVFNNCNKADGAYYLLKPEDWCFIPGVGDAHKILSDNGYLISWVTSQETIGMGLITRQKLEQMFKVAGYMIESYIEKYEAINEIVIIDPGIVGKDSDPAVHKAKSDAKLNAMLDLVKKYDVDISQSLGVGDRKSDITSFEQAGIGHKFQILTPFGDDESLGADGYFHSLLECVQDFVLPF